MRSLEIKLTNVVRRVLLNTLFKTRMTQTEMKLY